MTFETGREDADNADTFAYLPTPSNRQKSDKLKNSKHKKKKKTNYRIVSGNKAVQATENAGPRLVSGSQHPNHRKLLL